MIQTKIKCAETGVEIGPGTGIDIYKWTVTTFGLPDVGVDQLLKLYKGKTDERATRILKNLAAIAGE
jgi:hypothetical protein